MPELVTKIREDSNIDSSMNEKSNQSAQQIELRSMQDFSFDKNSDNEI